MCNCGTNGTSSSKGACRNCQKLDKQIKEAKDKLDSIKRNVEKSRAEMAALDAKEKRLNLYMAMFGQTKKK